MKYLFIVNPIAGGVDRTEEIRAMAKDAFSGLNIPWELYVTTRPNDATEQIQLRAAQSGEKLRVLACGGDGTFNECCNGAAGLENIAVAPFPYGTGNDFCRMFGDEKELYRNLNAIIRGSEHKIDLIDVNGRKCACISSIGIDARVGTNVHKYSSFPLIGGKAAYIVSLLVELGRGLYTNMKITAPGYSYDAPSALCCVCNGRHYGGGFNPSPDAMPDDGIADVYVVKKVNLPTIALNIGKYASGRADSVPNLIEHIKVSDLKIELDEESVINIDGESLYSRVAEFHVLPRCMNLIVPDGITFFKE